MKLHLNAEEFSNAVQATAEKLGIRDIFVEKDYWVTYILKNLSNSEFKEEVVFKGGTSLSKAHNLIGRFSEDVDLVILGKEKLTGSQIKTKLRNIEKALINSPLTEDKVFNSSSKASKGTKFRKTGYLYPKNLDNYDFGHATETLILELNSFANPHPEEYQKIESYIAQYFRRVKSEQFISEYALEAFEVKVLGLERTFTEKILNLSRLSNHDDDRFSEMRNRVRHFYDIHKLMEHDQIQKLLDGNQFHGIIEMALRDDFSNPDFNDSWINGFLGDARLFKEIDDVFLNIGNVYKNEFTSLLYDGEEVDLDDIKASFKLLISKMPNVEIIKAK